MYLALATATLVSASPVVAPAEAEMVARATGNSELENGACRPYTFIFARGSGELGSMVRDAQNTNTQFYCLVLSRRSKIVY